MSTTEPDDAPQDEPPQHDDSQPDSPPDDSPPDDRPAEAPVVAAEGIALSGDRGPVYGPLSFDVPAGALAVILGAEGSGRTALLLTCTGRMKPTAGSITVLGRRLPRGRSLVHRRAALAGVAAVDTLDDTLTVAEVLTERVGLLTPLWRPLRRIDDDEVARLVQRAFGDEPLPRAGQKIYELSAVQLLLLRISLALLGDPELLGVDDIDVLADPEDQRRIWRRLAALARADSPGRPLTVLAAATALDQVPAGATTIPLDHHPRHAESEN